MSRWTRLDYIVLETRSEHGDIDNNLMERYDGVNLELTISDIDVRIDASFSI